MSPASKTDAVSRLEKANSELAELKEITEVEIASVTKAFEGLTGYTDSIMDITAKIVARVESDNVISVRPKVQALGAAANSFISDRLRATTGILEMVTREVDLLQQLSVITRSQRAIARQTGALSVLTNIEVAHLGTVSADFHYVARELGDFFKSVTEDTQALDVRTEDRKTAIENTRQILFAEIPGMQEKLAGIEADLHNALAQVDSSLTQLSNTPAQFRMGLQEIAGQISGVVTAIQAHDITRQQIEHVQEALTLISQRLRSDQPLQNAPGQRLSQAYAGLTIQIYQLRTIKEIIAGWASQIRTCMTGILRVSASEMAGMGSLVLELEKRVLSQLARIESLERESQAYGERIQSTFSGLSNLMQLFKEHLQRSKSVRDRFQILSFNSTIEASHLGKKADAILPIAKRIGGISEEWNRITAQSGEAMREILSLVEQSGKWMEAFSEASNQRLREVQAQTKDGLETLRTAAAFAVGQSREMKTATEKMLAKIVSVGKTGEQLDSCFSRFDAVLKEIESVRHLLQADHPEVEKLHDTAAVEQLFSASYTTEMERDVMHAALRGAALPVAQQTFEGNSVELF
jgi:hypothetical protein